MKIVCLGEVMVELSLSSDSEASLGFAGDTFNTAIYLNRLLPKSRVYYATKLGLDPLSARITNLMQDEGIGTELVLQSSDRLPGLYAISTDDAGERSFLYWRDRAAVRTLFDDPALDLNQCSDADLFYFSAISLAVLPETARESLFVWLETFSGLTAFDSNYRPALWPDQKTAQQTCERAWRLSDIGLPSLDDEMALFDDETEAQSRSRLAAWGVTDGALKRGHSGPVGLDGSTTNFASVSKVVDSTAAGDSFNAGYLAARLLGDSEADALASGHTLASKVIQHRGAILPRGAT